MRYTFLLTLEKLGYGGEKVIVAMKCSKSGNEVIYIILFILSSGSNDKNVNNSATSSETMLPCEFCDGLVPMKKLLEHQVSTYVSLPNSFTIHFAKVLCGFFMYGFFLL